jgi:hypothetical protein
MGLWVALGEEYSIHMFSKVELENRIAEQVRCLTFAMGRTPGQLQVFFHNEKNPDYARMLFCAFTLARLHRALPHLSPPKSALIHLVTNVYTKAGVSGRSPSLCLYAMRALQALEADYGYVLEDFLQLDHAPIFTYPVTMYICISAGFECPLFLENTFARSLHNHALATLDFVLHTENTNWNPFQFAEVSAWHGKVPPSLECAALSYMDTHYPTTFISKNASSSGIAKCLEHFARVRDYTALELGLKTLSERKLMHHTFIDPLLQPLAHLLSTETLGSQELCMDTSAHLINTYLYLYEHTY